MLLWLFWTTNVIRRYFEMSNFFGSKIVITFLYISLNMCFGWSKEPSHWDGSWEPTTSILVENKNIFSNHTLLSRGLNLELNLLWRLNTMCLIFQLSTFFFRWFSKVEIAGRYFYTTQISRNLRVNQANIFSVSGFYNNWIWEPLQTSLEPNQGWQNTLKLFGMLMVFINYVFQKNK